MEEYDESSLLEWYNSRNSKVLEAMVRLRCWNFDFTKICLSFIRFQFDLGIFFSFLFLGINCKFIKLLIPWWKFSLESKSYLMKNLFKAIRFVAFLYLSVGGWSCFCRRGVVMSWQKINLDLFIWISLEVATVPRLLLLFNSLDFFLFNHFFVFSFHSISSIVYLQFACVYLISVLIKIDDHLDKTLSLLRAKHLSIICVSLSLFHHTSSGALYHSLNEFRLNETRTRIFNSKTWSLFHLLSLCVCLYVIFYFRSISKKQTTIRIFLIDLIYKMWLGRCCRCLVPCYEIHTLLQLSA